MAIRPSDLFASVVHDAPAADVRPSGLFGTVVHDAPAANVRPSGLFGTVVHDVPSLNVLVTNLFCSVVHDAPSGRKGQAPLQGDRIRSHFPLQGVGLRLPPSGKT